MENFKVSLESLYNNKIKEINFEEEETYQEKPTLSQRLVELAQRVDFRNAAGEEGAEPPSKKPAQQWPWQQANSKLRMALTEASVLSDVIQIVQHQQKYVALNQVVAYPSSTTTPTYQYVMKKRSLGVAAEILRRGMESLSVSSTDREREFHRAIALLRQRWRLKRVGSGVVTGDLSYRSAGSVYSGAVNFDVCKNMAAPDSALFSDVVKVTVPRELRGTSEILVFLSPQPIREMPPLASFPSPLPLKDLFQHDGGGWKEKLSNIQLELARAQNVLFNQELFAQLAKEAYNQKLDLQHEVSTNKINIPLSQDCWLSVLYVHERDHTPSSSPSSSWPPPRWDLVVTLKQLLRENHRQRATLVVPRPSTMGFLEFTEVKSAATIRNAGVIPLKGKDLKELTTVKKTLFSQFFDKARHLHNEERLIQWLRELQQTSQDPLVTISWKPHPSHTIIVALLSLKDSMAPQDKECGQVKVVLRVDQVMVEREEQCGGNISFTLQRDKLLGVLKHYITFLHMLSAHNLAEEHKWHVIQEVPRPYLSPVLAKCRKRYPESSNLFLESADAQVKVEVLFFWNNFIASVGSLVESGSGTLPGGMDCVEWQKVDEEELATHGSPRDKFMHLLNKN